MSANLTAAPPEWLTTTTDVEVHANACAFDYPSALYQWYVPPYSTYVMPSRIRLTLGEVERLRKAAKSDEKLKAILYKFTPHIDIIMSLE